MSSAWASTSRWLRLVTFTAGVVSMGTGVFYLLPILPTSQPTAYDVAQSLVFLAATSVPLLAGAWSPWEGGWVLASSLGIVGNTAWGILGAGTIGAPLVVAAGLAGTSLLIHSQRGGRTPRLLVSVGAVVALVLISVQQSVLSAADHPDLSASCRYTHGHVQGTTTFDGRVYHITCSDGRVTRSSP